MFASFFFLHLIISERMTSKKLTCHRRFSRPQGGGMFGSSRIWSGGEGLGGKESSRCVKLG